MSVFEQQETYMRKFPAYTYLENEATGEISVTYPHGLGTWQRADAIARNMAKMENKKAARRTMQIGYGVVTYYYSTKGI